jgi:hypothetical protein
MKKVQHRKRPAAAVKLAASAAGLAVCVTCFCSVTWAYFTYNIESQPVTLASAYYKLNITAVDGSGNTIEEDPNNPGTYKIPENARVSFKITGQGTAKSGYARIVATDSDGEEYSWDTVVISDEPFEVDFAEYSTVKITSVWGESSDDNPLHSGCYLGTTFESIIDEVDLTDDPDFWGDQDEDSESSPVVEDSDPEEKTDDSSEKGQDKSDEANSPNAQNSESTDYDQTEAAQQLDDIPAAASLDEDDSAEVEVTEESGE